MYYNAYDTDIAIVNIFFGDSTVFGEFPHSVQMHQQVLFCRIWKVAKDDLAGLHFWLWRPLWTLPWYQLCVDRWDSLLVLDPALQELLIHPRDDLLHNCSKDNHLTCNVLCHNLWCGVYSSLYCAADFFFLSIDFDGQENYCGPLMNFLNYEITFDRLHSTLAGR